MVKKYLKRLLIFALVIALLFYLKAHQFSFFSSAITNSFQLTERKILFLSLIIFFIIFRISSRILALFGLASLFIVAFFALAGRMALFNRLLVYSWGLLLLAGLMQIPELVKKKK